MGRIRGCNPNRSERYAECDGRAVILVARALTKTQKKRMVTSIKDKGFRLLGLGLITVADYEKMVSIYNRAIKKVD